MAMTKEYYYEMGRKNAFNGGQGCPQPGWRHDAFMQGFDDARREAAQASMSPTGRIVSAVPNLQTIPINSPEAKRVIDAFLCRPKLTARQEHIRLLRIEVNKVGNPIGRVRRLYDKIDVLTSREALCGST